MKRPPKGFEIWALAVPLIIVGLPILYLLAFGPLAYLEASRWISDETFEWLAIPGNWAADRGWLKPAGVQEPLKAYIQWWLELSR